MFAKAKDMLTKLFKPSKREFWFFLEAIMTIAFAQLALVLFSFKRISSYMGSMHRESSQYTSADEGIIIQISHAIRRASKYSFWKPRCYAQAIAGKIMLKRRNVEGTIYLGVRKKKNLKNTEGHAWLRSGDSIITGKTGHKSYKVMVTYS